MDHEAECVVHDTNYSGFSERDAKISEGILM